MTLDTLTLDMIELMLKSTKTDADHIKIGQLAQQAVDNNANKLTLLFYGLYTRGFLDGHEMAESDAKESQINIDFLKTYTAGSA